MRGGGGHKQNEMKKHYNSLNFKISQFKKKHIFFHNQGYCCVCVCGGGGGGGKN